MRMRVTKTVLTLSMLGGLVISCGTEHSESCEWEQERKSKTANSLVLPELVGKVGGSSGGRGGSSGSRGGSGGGSKPNMNKGSSGGSGGASKPRYNKSNPAPKPKSSPAKGYVWVWDCE